MRTPQPIAADLLRVQEMGPWGIWFRNVYSALFFLLTRPVLLSGLNAAKPNATLYPENSRYYSTDTTTEYINLYATPGNPATAVWTAM